MVVREEGGRGGEGNITEVCLQETGGLGVDCIIDNGGEGGREEGGGEGREGNITEVCLQETGGLGVDCIIDNGGEGGRGGREGRGGRGISQRCVCRKLEVWEWTVS